MFNLVIFCGKELVFSSKTIMDRTEGVYIVIREIVEKTHNDHFRTAHSIPIPELVVYNSINKIASDATIEELMGNFRRYKKALFYLCRCLTLVFRLRSACESYDFSLSLMDSLSITAFHVEDQRKLHMEHRVLQDKYQRCKSKEEAMWEY